MTNNFLKANCLPANSKSTEFNGAETNAVQVRFTITLFSTLYVETALSGHNRNIGCKPCFVTFLKPPKTFLKPPK